MNRQSPTKDVYKITNYNAILQRIEELQCYFTADRGYNKINIKVVLESISGLLIKKKESIPGLVFVSSLLLKQNN